MENDKKEIRWKVEGKECEINFPLNDQLACTRRMWKMITINEDKIEQNE